jgi:nitrate/TMAO reductase-like tetraheme cytochrome c subunit
MSALNQLPHIIARINEYRSECRECHARMFEEMNSYSDSRLAAYGLNRSDLRDIANGSYDG